MQLLRYAIKQGQVATRQAGYEEAGHTLDKRQGLARRQGLGAGGCGSGRGGTPGGTALPMHKPHQRLGFLSICGWRDRQPRAFPSLCRCGRQSVPRTTAGAQKGTEMALERLRSPWFEGARRGDRRSRTWAAF